MPETDFIEKFLQKIEKIDRLSLQSYIQNFKREKDFYVAAFESLMEGVVVLGKEGKILYHNKTAQTILGLSESSVRRNRSFLKIIEDKELQRFFEIRLGRHEHVFQEEVEVLLPRHGFLSISISPFMDIKNDLAGTVILLVNTSFPRERDRQILKMQKLESLASLAAGIAHEIGNPLNSIGIYLKLAEKEIEELPASQKKKLSEIVDVISGETKRLDSMVKNFLKAARRKPIRLAEEDINEILEAVLKFLSPEMARLHIKCVCKMNRELPPFFIDGEKMHQVFINIIKNAIESMPKGGLLEVGTFKKERLCGIVFRDTGFGIPEEDLPKIFDAYYTTKREGSGLGLMIVSSIIQEHGGRIEVKSKRGEGTTFTIYLPIRKQKLQLSERTGEKT